MLVDKVKEKSSIRIGELLVQAELMQAETMEAAATLAARMRVPLGRILSMEGHISENILQAGLELQSRIADKLIEVDVGVKALQFMARKGLSLDDALLQASALETAADQTSLVPATEPVPVQRIVPYEPASVMVPSLSRAESQHIDLVLPHSVPVPERATVCHTSVSSNADSASVTQLASIPANAPLPASDVSHFTNARVQNRQKTRPLGSETSFLLMGLSKNEEPVTARPPQTTALQSSGLTNPNSEKDAQADSNDETLMQARAIEGVETQAENAIDCTTHDAVSSQMPQPAAKANAKAGAGSTNRLGDLLIAAGILNALQIDKALVHGRQTGLPLGSVLVGMGLISHALLNNALTAQRMIRAEEVTREKALHALKAAQLRCQSIHKSLEHYDWYARTTTTALDLGELLNLAGVLTTDELLSIRQLELVEEKPFEEIVITRGFTDDKIIAAAKQLLAMIEEGELLENDAALILRRLKNVEGEELPEFLVSLLDADTEVDEVGLRELILESGLLTEQEMEAACAVSLTYKMPLAKTLYESGLVENWQLECVLRCQEFINNGLFELEQSFIGLSYALEKHLSYDETIYAFGWTLPMEIATV